MTDPFVPAEVDLRDYDFMPFYGQRLFDSDTWALCDADEKVAALRLWWRSWHEEPAASLPDNDRLLADRAGYGVAVKAFLAVKENAMRGWIKCSDGRLYHPVVASIALEVWRTKRKKKDDNAADRERKRLKRLGGNEPDKPEFPADKPEFPAEVRVENALKKKGRKDEGKLSPTVSNETFGESGARAPGSLSQKEFLIDDDLLAEAEREREKAGLPKTNLKAEARKYQLTKPGKQSREGWLKWALGARASRDEATAEPKTDAPTPGPTPIDPRRLGHFPDCGCPNCLRWQQAKSAA